LVLEFENDIPALLNPPWSEPIFCKPINVYPLTTSSDNIEETRFSERF
jgi:hypothetical protein